MLIIFYEIKARGKISAVKASTYDERYFFSVRVFLFRPSASNHRMCTDLTAAPY
jgi:hypothetical protein